MKTSYKLESRNTKFNLRIVPWFTDSCSTFLSNFLKWYPASLGKRLSVLEFGGGNSSLFFLSKGLRVVSIEADKSYVDFLSNVAQGCGFSVQVFSDGNSYVSDSASYDLAIIFTDKLSEVLQAMDLVKADIIVNDGIFRREVLDKISIDRPNSIVVLDNVEYAANWGHLDRSSAKPLHVKSYRSFLRSADWQAYIFEQTEGRKGGGIADKTGWESVHRWMSAVSWPKDHVLQELMITHRGFPVVNALGIKDQDVETLEERCPFDWEKMKWLREPFPEELDLKLDRGFS